MAVAAYIILAFLVVYNVWTWSKVIGHYRAIGRHCRESREIIAQHLDDLGSHQMAKFLREMKR